MSTPKLILTDKSSPSELASMLADIEGLEIIEASDLGDDLEKEISRRCDGLDEVIVVEGAGVSKLAAQLAKIDGVEVLAVPEADSGLDGLDLSDVDRDIEANILSELRRSLHRVERIKEYPEIKLRFDQMHNGHPTSFRKSKKR